jgi:hypothetical protein
MNNPTISISNSSLPEGTYKLTDLITGNAEGNIIVTSGGTIDGSLSIALPLYSSMILKADLATGIHNINNVPVLRTFKLEQNFPNPFNPNTTISFEIPSAGSVKLSVYNLLGQKVKNLFDGNLVEGMHSVKFDGTDLNSGVYIYKLENNGYSISRKMILLK